MPSVMSDCWMVKVGRPWLVPPCSKVSAAVRACASATSRPWASAVALGRECLLRVVQFASLEGFEAGDLIEREFGEKLKEPADIGIFRVAPVLPVVVGAQHIFIQPDRAADALAHLGA